MLSVHSLGFAYQKKKILEEVSFSVSSGGFTAIAGGNGSGKTTLLLLLAGLLSPNQGFIQIKDQKSPGQEKEIRRICKLLLQEAELQILGNTVGEDLLLGVQAKAKEIREKALLLAEKFSLTDLWDFPVQQLSGGQKRKLSLAAVLLQEPEVLLFDEPFSGLDYSSTLEFREILKKDRERGQTQVAAVHDLEPLIDLIDQLVLLKQGRVALVGRPEEVLDLAVDCGIRPPCLWQREKRIFAWN